MSKKKGKQSCNNNKVDKDNKNNKASSSKLNLAPTFTGHATQIYIPTKSNHTETQAYWQNKGHKKSPNYFHSLY